MLFHIDGVSEYERSAGCGLFFIMFLTGRRGCGRMEIEYRIDPEGLLHGGRTGGCRRARPYAYCGAGPGSIIKMEVRRMETRITYKNDVEDDVLFVHQGRVTVGKKLYRKIQADGEFWFKLVSSNEGKCKESPARDYQKMEEGWEG